MSPSGEWEKELSGCLMVKVLGIEPRRAEREGEENHKIVFI